MNDTLQRTVSASYMDTLLDAFAEAGGSRHYLLEKAGLDESALKNPDNRLPVETVTKVWVAAKDKTSNPLLGLRVGEHIRPGSFSVLGHLLMTAATVRDALNKASRFATLVGDGGTFSVSMDTGDAVLHYDLVEKDIPCRDERIEAVMASLVGFSRWISGQNIIPRYVRFSHAPLADLEAYKSVFLIDPEFNRSDNSIVLSKADLDLPLVQSNPELSVLLDGHAEKVMTRVTQVSPFILQVRQALKNALNESPLELEQIADSLGLAPRSLQRKLSELGTTFQDQLNQCRKDWAMEQLQNGQTPISEIAFSLGFSDPASFNRAFKRWTGKPPATWLKDHQVS